MLRTHKKSQRLQDLLNRRAHTGKDQTEDKILQHFWDRAEWLSGKNKKKTP